MCFYVVGWYDYEWNEEYVLFNPSCPSKEQFRNDVRNAVNSIMDRLLMKDGFIGAEDVAREVVKELAKYGYSAIRYIDKIEFWGGVIIDLEDCLDHETNREIIGEENCRKIGEHNKEVKEYVQRVLNKVEEVMRKHTR